MLRCSPLAGSACLVRQSLGPRFQIKAVRDWPQRTRAPAPQVRVPVPAPSSSTAYWHWRRYGYIVLFLRAAPSYLL